MNYKKLDAALAMALNQVQDPDERSLVVFIHTQPLADNSNAAAILENLGISGITEKKTYFLLLYLSMKLLNFQNSLGCSI